MHIEKKNEDVLAIGIVVAATMIALIIGINSKSLWIDECLVYKYINFPNAKEVLKTALDATGSEKRVCPKFCVNTAKQCKIEPKYFKAGAASAVAALSTK